jgi:hypothetical protein
MVKANGNSQATIDPMDLDAARSQFLTDGYCCLENVITTERVDEIRENVTRDVWANSWLERPTGYVPGFLRVNQSLAPYLASESVLGLVRSFFGPHVRISMLTGTVNARAYLAARCTLTGHITSLVRLIFQLLTRIASCTSSPCGCFPISAPKAAERSWSREATEDPIIPGWAARSTHLNPIPESGSLRAAPAA